MLLMVLLLLLRAIYQTSLIWRLAQEHCDVQLLLPAGA
jgi:hypothetical protein